MFEVFDEAVAADGGEPVTPVATMTTSLALPGQPRPAGLNSVSIAGDRGFDPLGFGKDKETILKYRSAEIKHARLAMLAAAGWPISELWDTGIANALGLPSIIEQNNGLAPAVLNGGLGLISPVYFGAVLLFAMAAELKGLNVKEMKQGADPSWMMTGSWTPGDLGFDPLGLYGFNGAKKSMETAEIKNGRVAMIGITVMCIQEFIEKKVSPAPPAPPTAPPPTAPHPTGFAGTKPIREPAIPTSAKALTLRLLASSSPHPSALPFPQQPVVELSPVFFTPFWELVAKAMMESPMIEGYPLN